MSKQTMMWGRRLMLAAGAVAALAPLAGAQAQAFPSKPVTLIVPWPAGGSTDRHLRALSELASKHLGQQIIIENKPGGGGTLGPGTMAQTAKPDGYTISQYPLGMLRIPHMQKTAWDPLNDFTFIIGISGYTFGFTVKSDSPFKSFNDYIEAARKAPGQINDGSTGTGSSPHLLLEELAGNAKVQLNHIPFKGNADLQQALLGGHVMAQSDASGWDKFVDGGQMRLLVTFGEQRTKRWPQVPTAKELGYNVVSTSPYGLAGPKGMDPAVVKALHDAYKKAMDDPKHIELLEQLNQAMWYRNGAEYRQWAVETYAKDKALIERLGLAAK
ncbi:tripartite tricarboxylate transporter substrate binding protein [Paucibacter sp. XJ19-41]|uniref:tripartite tricarboxylate transporter substrate binding protein n=1 Tax=Paucibacter sp. XJ19-41 TaxID=2927824 RepID=UPI0023494098|nr:tripartite tricarboxylate transporter substrate binding protein [Paucibacter sp. XJ19-41]MDC6170061.1 tripartite tricarboxylate transporter substrate binding protein [Paucibacter sp. XJ19-41]